MNNDDRRVRNFGRVFPGKVLTFGVEAAAAYRASEIRSLGLEGQELRLDHKAQGHRLLLPLIGAVADRIYEYEPAAIQTGPALRNDEATIQKHLALLQHHPPLKVMYTLFTDSIKKMYKV